MKDIIEIASRISSPLALSGLIASILFFLFRQILAKDIFPKLIRSDSVSLLRTIIDRLFILALIAMILGFLGYLIQRAPRATATAPVSDYESDPPPEEEFSPSGGPEEEPSPPPFSKAPPPFRVSYFLLEGHAVDFFLDHQIERSWNSTLNGTAYLVPNEVFSLLQSYQSRFSVPGPYEIDTLEVSSAKTLSGPVDEVGYASVSADFLANKHLLPMTWGDPLFDLGFVLTEDDFVAVVNKAIHDPGWHPSSEGNFLLGVQPGDTTFVVEKSDFSAWKYLNATELRSFAATYRDRFENDELGLQRLAFLLEISKDGLPSGFVAEMINYSDCGSYAELSLAFPRMRVRIAVIENTTKNPLRIGPFEFTIRNTKRFMPRSISPFLEDKREPLYPQGVLMPGERIAIPIELFFGDYRWEWVKYDKYVDEDILRAKDRPRKLLGFCLNRLKGKLFEGDADEWESEVRPQFKVQDFCSFLSRFDSTIPEVEKPIVSFGPSLTLKSVEVNGLRYHIRRFDPKLLLISSGIAVGSCPYLYTFNPQRDDWRSEGTFLVGNDSKRRERFDSIPLQQFHGLVELREEEPEVTYLDSAFLRIVCPGTEYTLHPTDARLLENDGAYVVLRQGEKLTLQFDSPPQTNNCRASFAGTGYYLSNPAKVGVPH
jgi:hypothetical protein